MHHAGDLLFVEGVVELLQFGKGHRVQDFLSFCIKDLSLLGLIHVFCHYEYFILG